MPTFDLSLCLNKHAAAHSMLARRQRRTLSALFIRWAHRQRSQLPEARSIRHGWHSRPCMEVAVLMRRASRAGVTSSGRLIGDKSAGGRWARGLPNVGSASNLCSQCRCQSCRAPMLHLSLSRSAGRQEVLCDANSCLGHISGCNRALLISCVLYCNFIDLLCY